MIDTECGQPENPRELLERLIVDDADFERLEGILSRFNIFEALGMVVQELRHSDFLRFLLDPNASHGLGDLFAKRFLQAVLAEVRRAGKATLISPVELDVVDLSEAEVLRERRRIDILFVDNSNKLVIAIENKIWAGEGEGQLESYLNYVEQEYQDWRKLFLYLSPSGEEKLSRPEYLPVSHALVRDVVDGIILARGEALDPPVLYALEHYSQTLGRHILGDIEIVELCKKIYRKHRAAFELVYEHRPDLQDEIREVLEDLVKETNDELQLDNPTKVNIRFAVSGWDTQAMKRGDGRLTASKRILLFEWNNKSDQLLFKLILGPGDKEVRRRLYEMAKRSGTPFHVPAGIGRDWNRLYSRTWLTGKDLAEKEPDELLGRVHEEWQLFRHNILPGIDAVLRKENWFWEESTSEEEKPTS